MSKTTIKRRVELVREACQERDAARTEWETADAKITAMTWDQHHYRAAVDARMKAAKQWTEANMKIIQMKAKQNEKC